MFLSLTRAAVVLLLAFPVANACVCADTPSVAESFSKAAAVFEGTVIRRAKYGAWLRVDKSWKGASSRTIYLYTGNLRNDCDPWFGKRGERWLVYAHSHLCSVTRTLRHLILENSWRTGVTEQPLLRARLKI